MRAKAGRRGRTPSIGKDRRRKGKGALAGDWRQEKEVARGEDRVAGEDSAARFEKGPTKYITKDGVMPKGSNFAPWRANPNAAGRPPGATMKSVALENYWHSFVKQRSKNFECRVCVPPIEPTQRPLFIPPTREARQTQEALLAPRGRPTGRKLGRAAGEEVENSPTGLRD